MKNIQNNEQAGTYLAVSSFGMSFFARKNADVLISPEMLKLTSSKESVEARISQMYSISKSWLIAPVNMILMLMISGLCAFGCQFYRLSVMAFVIVCLSVVALVVLGMNHRVQITMNDGTIINIDTWDNKTAQQIYNDIIGREECPAQKTKKVYILEIITALVIVLFVSINAYDCFVPDKYVEIVKNSENADYTGVTYGAAFEKYFTEPEWTSFDSKNNNKIVEFTGKYNDNGKQSEVVIQYVVDGEYFDFAYYEVDGTAGTLSEYMDLMKLVLGQK